MSSESGLNFRETSKYLQPDYLTGEIYKDKKETALTRTLRYQRPENFIFNQYSHMERIVLKDFTEKELA